MQMNHYCVFDTWCVESLQLLYKDWIYFEGYLLDCIDPCGARLTKSLEVVVVLYLQLHCSGKGSFLPWG